MSGTSTPIERASVIVPTELTFRQVAMLSVLSRHKDGELGVGTLAQLLGLAKSVVTRALSKFERLGLASRCHDKFDLRLTPITLHPTGRKLLADLDQALAT